MRAWLWMLLGLVAFFPACGGGGSTPVSGSTAEVVGAVKTKNGSTDALGGLRVTLTTNGETTTTDPQGGFALRVPAGQTFAVRFEDPAEAGTPGNDVDESDDPTPDASDIDGDVVSVGPLSDGETCHVDVEMENGNVAESWMDRQHDGADDHDGESRLLPPDGTDAPGRVGEAEVACGQDCCGLEIEVRGLEGPATYDVQLWNPDGDTADLASLDVAADGQGRLALRYCTGDELPFGATTLQDLAGYEVVLVDSEGTIQLRGMLPGPEADHREHDHPRALLVLTPPDGSPDPDAVGAVSVRIDDGCVRVVLEVSHVTTTASLEAVLVPATGDEIDLGTIEIDDLGMGRLVLASCGENALPADLPISNPSDLIGMVLELRDPDGAVVLEAEVPQIEMPPHLPPSPALAGDADLVPPDSAPSPDATGKVVVLTCGDRGAVVVEVRGLTGPASYDVELAAEGATETLGGIEVAEQGCGRFVFEVGADTTLPFGATTLADLAGDTLSIVDAEGTVLLEAILPTLAPADAQHPEGHHEHGNGL